MKKGKAQRGKRRFPIFAEALESRRLLTTLPSGFLETRLAQGLESVTAMTLAPDGRVFVSQQNGVIRVIKDGQLLDDPFASLSVGLNLELGLHSLAFDPNFATNHYIYAFLTTPELQNVIVRLSANGDAMVPGSQTTIFSLDALYTSIFHQGGAMKFMPDGTLLISNGDEGNAYQAQLFASYSGKMIRINTDGSIPTDNPFYNQLSGDLRSIWALGLRNPYTFDIQPGTGRILISDVGENSWEEINEATPGANFGWATTEGHFDPQAYPDLTNPLYIYPHSPSGAAITGGAFYNPADPSFGSQYVGDYFFCDFVSGWIKALDLSGPAPQVVDFATGISGPQFTTVGPDGSLYYLEYNTGSVWQVQLADGLIPTISNQPQDQTVSLDEPATFEVTAAGPGITYQWQRDNQDIEGATDPTYVLSSPAIGDDGAQLQCVVTNQYGTITSDPATLTVLNNHLPSPIILTPLEGSTYTAGDTIDFSGEAFDTEDGALGAAAFTWKVEFHHHTHIHPFIPETSGISSGSFVIPTNGETDSDVWYRIILTAQDSAGGTRTVYRDITPITAQIAISSNVPGLQVTLDSQPQNTPYTFTGVAGMIRALAAPASQTVGGQEYDFVGWSDGGTITHNISTPASDTNLVATYVDVTAPTISQWTFGWDDPVHPQSISVQFSEEVSGIDSVDDISVINSDTLQVIHPVSFSYDHDTHTALFIMPALADANYSVTLAAGAVQDASGNSLAEASNFGFFALGGDANHDRTVDLLDMMALSPNWLNSGATFSQGDFNYDGTVNARDLSIIARNYQQRLDPPQVLHAVSWDGGGDGTTWTDPLNWSNDQLPTATDIVTIASGSGVVLSGAEATVKELHSSIPLALDHAALTVNGDVTLDADTSLQAANLNIDGDLTLNATLLLNNGYSNPASRLEFFGRKNRLIKGAGTINSLTDDNTSYILNSTHNEFGDLGLTLTLGSGIHVVVNDTVISSTVPGGVIVNNGVMSTSNSALGSNDLFVNNGTEPTASFINNGTIEVGWYTSMTNFQNKGAITVISGELLLDGHWRNDGTLTLNEASLNLGGDFTIADLGNFVRTGGTVNIVGILENADSTFTLNDSTGSWNLYGAIIGGTYQATGSNHLIAMGGLLNGVIVDGPILVAGNDLHIINNLVLNSTMTLDIIPEQENGGGRVYFDGEADQTIDGTGTIQSLTEFNQTYIVNNTVNPDDNSGRQLTIGSGILITGRNLQIQSTHAGGTIINNGTLTELAGTVTANGVSSGSWVLGNSDGWVINNGSISAWNMEATNLHNTAGHTIDVNGPQLLLDGDDWQNDGTIALTDAALNLGGNFVFANVGAVTRDNSSISIVGTLDNTGLTFTLDNTTGSWNLSDNGILLGGTYQAVGANQLFGDGGTLDGVIVNAPIAVAGYSSLHIIHGITLNSTLTIGDPTSNSWGQIYFVGDSDQSVLGTGSIISALAGVDSQYDYIVNATYNPETGSGAKVTFGSGVTLSGGAVFMYSSVTGGVIVNKGLLNMNAGPWNVGSFFDSFQNDGVISLGSDHALIVNGDFVQTSSGTINATLAGTSAGTEFGQIVVSGNATIDGTLAVSLAPSYDPDETASFPIVVATALSGTFATFTGGPTPSGRTLQMQYNATQAVVDVAPVLASPLVIAPTGAAPATYLSDLTPVSAVNGFGSFEKDHSNGGARGNDGKTIKLNGKTYAKGLGAHAGSTIVYNLNGQYSQFISDIGVDDEVGNKGSVVFQVFADGKKIYDSGKMTGSSATKSIDLDITGKQQLKLVVTDSGNGKDFDHADWAGARLVNPLQSNVNVAASTSDHLSHLKKKMDLISMLNS